MAFGRSKDSSGDPTPTPRTATAPTQASVIAQGMTLDGDCEAQGSLQVDGHVKGNVRAARLTIGPDGRVDGDVDGSGDGSGDRAVIIKGTVGGSVRAPSVQVGPEGSIGAGMKVNDAVIRGRVMGAIETEQRLLLEETAVVEGDVIARRLGLKEGGQVFGTIRIGERPSKTRTESRGAGEASTGTKSGSAASADRPDTSDKPDTSDDSGDDSGPKDTTNAGGGSAS